MGRDGVRGDRISRHWSGLTLWSNGLAALDVLGVGEEVRAAGNDLTCVRILDSTGRELMRQESGPGTVLALHRRDLNATLLGALTAGVVRTSTSASVVDVENGIVDAGGRTEQYDLVVAADGVHSPTRLRWWPETGGERDCGIRAWRAVVDGPVPRRSAWGRSGECGILPLADGTAYVFGASRGKARDKGLGYFDDWVEPVPTLLRRIEEPLVHELTDLKAVRHPVKGTHRDPRRCRARDATAPRTGCRLVTRGRRRPSHHCSPSGGFDGAGFTAARRRRWATVSFLAALDHADDAVEPGRRVGAPGGAGHAGPVDDGLGGPGRAVASAGLGGRPGAPALPDRDRRRPRLFRPSSPPHAQSSVAH